MKDKISKAGMLILGTTLFFLISLVLFKRINGVTTPDKLLHMAIGIIIASTIFIITMKSKLNGALLFLLVILTVLVFEFFNDYSVHNGVDLIKFYTGGDEMIDVYASLIGATIAFLFLSAD